MFNHIEKKIRLITVMTISIYITLISITAFITIRQNILDDFIKLSEQYSVQQNQNMRLYIRLIEETSNLIQKNANIIKGLESPMFDSQIQDILNNIMASRQDILGITIYSQNGITYTTSNLYRIPELDNMMENEIFNQFTDSLNPSLWWVRYRNMMGLFDSFNTDKSDGVLTFLLKIYDENNNLLGYMLMDTNLSSIYNFFKSDNPYFKNTGICVVTSNSEILQSDSSQLLSKSTVHDILTNREVEYNYVISENKRDILIYNRIPNSFDKVVLIVSQNGIYNMLWNLSALLIFICIIFIILSVIFSRFLSKSISLPLKKLYISMRNSIN